MANTTYTIRAVGGTEVARTNDADVAEAHSDEGFWVTAVTE